MRAKLLSGCLLPALASFAAFLPSSTAARAGSARQAQSPIHWIAVRRLARGALPGRQTFTISGERYRFQGRIYFTLSISVNRPGAPAGGGGGASFNPSQMPGTLAYTEMTVCGSHRYAVVFGLLRDPADVVVARRGAARSVLSHVGIPAVLHAGGVLAYRALSGPASEVTLKRPDGKRLRDDRLHSGGCSPGVAIIALT